MPSTPNPSPGFDPQSKEEVEARFGAKNASLWEDASVPHRRALISQLLSGEQFVRPPEQPQTLAGDTLANERWRERQNERRAATITIAEGKQNKISSKRELILGEITIHERLLQGASAAMIERMKREIAIRFLQIAMLTMLNEGALSYDACIMRTKADRYGKTLDDDRLRREYDAMLESLLRSNYVTLSNP